MIAHRFEGDHLTVSSDMTITPDVGKIGLSFMRLVLDGSQDALDELNSDTVCEGRDEGHWSCNPNTSTRGSNSVSESGTFLTARSLQKRSGVLFLH